MPISITGQAQADAWRARTMPPVEQLAPDLWSIPVPIPHSPLRYVSVYVLGGPDGVVLIDAGWNDDAAWAALNSGLAVAGASITDVRGVLVSHVHFDHVGLAQRIAVAAGAWVGLHREDATILVAENGRRAVEVLTDERVFLETLGASPAEAAQGAPSLEQVRSFQTAGIPDRWIEDGDVFTVGRHNLRAVHTPGHTPGHLTFHDQASGRLFAGDHLLPRITPNISVNRLWSDDPLSRYLGSLRTVAALEVDEVLPAHEWRFRGHVERVGEIVEHHDQRSQELLKAIERIPGSTAWVLAGELTWSRSWDQYSGALRASAVTETAAHLDHLVRAGHVERCGDRAPRYWLVST